MRRYITVFIGLLFALFAVFAVAQTHSNSKQSDDRPTTSTETTTTQTSTTTTTGKETSIEGCLIKEQSDFFLVPKSGNPIKLQPTAGENLSEHEGHKVRVRGNEMPITSASASNTGAGSSGGMTGAAAGKSSASGESNPGESNAVGAAAGTSQASESGAATGTGTDLHKLATEEMMVTKLQHIAPSCPVNWNSKVPTSSNTSGTKY